MKNQASLSDITQKTDIYREHIWTDYWFDSSYKQCESTKTYRTFDFFLGALWIWY